MLSRMSRPEFRDEHHRARQHYWTSDSLEEMSIGPDELVMRIPPYNWVRTDSEE
jgi:hypothetical protein